MAAKVVKAVNGPSRSLTAFVPNGTAYNLANATAAAQAKVGGADLLEALPGDMIEVLDQNTIPAGGICFAFRVVRSAGGGLLLQQFDFGLGVAAGQNRV